MSITFIFTFAAEHYALLFCLHQCRILLPFPSTSSSLDLLFIPLFFSPLFYTPISIFTPKSAFLILSYLLRSLLLSFFFLSHFKIFFHLSYLDLSPLLIMLMSTPTLSFPPFPFLFYIYRLTPTYLAPCLYHSTSFPYFISITHSLYHSHFIPYLLLSHTLTISHPISFLSPSLLSLL